VQLLFMGGVHLGCRRHLHRYRSSCESWLGHS
jgi:hypothetical protein